MPSRSQSVNLPLAVVGCPEAVLIDSVSANGIREWPSRPLGFADRYGPFVRTCWRHRQVRARCDPDPQRWRKLELRMEHQPGRFVDVVLIRPLGWIEEEEAAVGEVIWLELPEMHAAGDAEVLAISACPALEPGSGPVITGTFRHDADELVEIRVAGQPDPLRCTAEHPFWSATRHEFVAASVLRPGEEIETSTGTPALLTSITSRQHFDEELKVVTRQDVFA